MKKLQLFTFAIFENFQKRSNDLLNHIGASRCMFLTTDKMIKIKKTHKINKARERERRRHLEYINANKYDGKLLFIQELQTSSESELTPVSVFFF